MNNSEQNPQSYQTEVSSSIFVNNETSMEFVTPLKIMFKLYFFQKSQTGICEDDLKNKQQVETINLQFILSLSDLLKFENSLSGRFVGNCAVVTMSNNDKYFIDEKSFTDLSDAVSRMSA